MKLTYREITPEDADMMIKWRTADHVNSKMLNDIKYIKHENQIKWINSLYQNPFSYGWIIRMDNHDIGYASIKLIGNNHDIATCGFYIYDLQYRYSSIVTIYHLCNLCCSIHKIK